MASQRINNNTINTAYMRCFYEFSYGNGRCRQGINCKYSHDIYNSELPVARCPENINGESIAGGNLAMARRPNYYDGNSQWSEPAASTPRAAAAITGAQEPRWKTATSWRRDDSALVSSSVPPVPASAMQVSSTQLSAHAAPFVPLASAQDSTQPSSTGASSPLVPAPAPQDAPQLSMPIRQPSKAAVAVDRIFVAQHPEVFAVPSKRIFCSPVLGETPPADAPTPEMLMSKYLRIDPAATSSIILRITQRDFLAAVMREPCKQSTWMYRRFGPHWLFMFRYSKKCQDIMLYDWISFSGTTERANMPVMDDFTPADAWPLKGNSLKDRELTQKAAVYGNIGPYDNWLKAHESWDFWE